jgi:hypothetical protein
MHAVRFLRIYTTLCHSVLQVVRCGKQMVGRHHKGLYLRIVHPEFITASVTVDVFADTIYRQFVCSVLEHHPVVFDVFATATSFPRSAWQIV